MSYSLCFSVGLKKPPLAPPGLRTALARALLKPAVVLLLLAAVPLPAAPRPNFLIILADDCTYNDLPIYGGRNAHTPNLDRLADHGLTFNHAYASMAMCQPCRSELYTGQYPLRNGCAWNHSASRPSTRSLPTYLAARGYRTGIAGKVDVFPKACFPFEDVPGFDGNCVDNPTKPHSLEGLRRFITLRNDQPFCLVIGLVEPHVPWVMGDPSQYPPARLQLPPNIADTPRTRQDFGKYLAEITYMDGQVGEILAALQAAGLETNTVVLFSSEQGSQFPGNKWTCWDTGLHTGLIARWPGRVPPGRRTDALVGYVDILPTLLDLAGASPAELGATLDGTSFAAVLRGERDTHRALAFGLHNNLPEGPPFPSRTVTDGDWRYIRNLSPEELYLQKYIMGLEGNGQLNNPYWGTWVFSSDQKPESYHLVKRYLKRPPEELYHTSADNYEMTNLCLQAQYQAIKTRLSAELDRWLAQQGDPGIALDTREALRAARDGKHLYGPAR